MRCVHIFTAVLACAALATTAVAEERKSYEGYRTVRIAADALPRTRAVAPDGVEVLNRRSEAVDLLVSPAAYAALREGNVAHSVLIGDVAQAIAAQRAPAPRDADWFAAYRSLSEINSYLDGLVAAFPERISRAQIGTSVEGRPIYAFTVSGAGDPASKPAIAYNTMIHAREWVTVMTGVYLLDRLVREYDTDPRIQALLDDVTVYGVPVLNPDGYDYSWNVDRFWRKNRALNVDGTFGVDLNRNFGYEWGGPGASDQPSAPIYHGPAPFSEPESVALRDFILAHPNINAHFDIHSFSQLILYPYGYAPELVPEKYHDDFVTLSQAMADAIRATNGEIYTPQQGIDLYAAAGVVMDWVTGDAHRLGWTFELRDDGDFGFLLPPDQIIPTAEETYAALVLAADELGYPLNLELDARARKYAPANQPAVLRFALEEFGRAYLLGSAVVYARLGDSGPFAEYSVEERGAGVFEVALPPATCGAEIQWYLQASVADGAIGTWPRSAPLDFFATRVVNVQELAAFDFETDQGWTRGPGTTTIGRWLRMDPQGTSAQPEDDVTPGVGVNCWVTDGRAGASANSFDVDGGYVILESPTLDLSAAQDPVIGYWRWFYNGLPGLTANDEFWVDLTADDNTWVRVEVLGPYCHACFGGWEYAEIFVAEHVSLTDSVRIRFTTGDPFPADTVEAALDEVRVLDFGCLGTLESGDLNGDGTVDGGDLNLLLSAWDCTGPCGRADINNDGLVGGGDLNLLLSNWDVAGQR